MIKTLIFDLGGTLLDTKIDFKASLDNLYCHLNNKTITKEEFLSYSLNLSNDLYNNRGEKEIKFNYYIKKVLEYFNTSFDINRDSVEEIFAFSFEYKIIEHAYQLLDIYKNKYKLVLLTNSTFSYKTIKKLLIKYDLFSYFDTIIVSSEFGKRKPNKELFNFAYNLADCNKDEIIFIGNSYDEDIIGANNIGINAIYYNQYHKLYKHSKNIYEIDSYMKLLGVDICQIF